MADDVTGAVRRTPRPYPSTEDHQTPETAAPVAPGATNPATPVSPDAGTATDDLSPEVVAALNERHGPELEALAEVGERGLAALRAALAETGTYVVGHVHDTSNDMQAFLELPDCEACGGTGKDDHASPFEAPLAVHFAGPPVRAEGRRRQLCMWCGHVLEDVPLSSGDAAWPGWPVGFLVRIEDGVYHGFPYDDGELPPGCCALPDDDVPDLGPAPSSPPCTCTENRCDFDDHDNPLTGDECVPCGQRPEGTPCCALDGPDEAQKTRAAADWPTEPEDGDRG